MHWTWPKHSDYGVQPCLRHLIKWLLKYNCKEIEVPFGREREGEGKAWPALLQSLSLCDTEAVGQIQDLTVDRRELLSQEFNTGLLSYNKTYKVSCTEN